MTGFHNNTASSPPCSIMIVDRERANMLVPVVLSIKHLSPALLQSRTQGMTLQVANTGNNGQKLAKMKQAFTEIIIIKMVTDGKSESTHHRSAYKLAEHLCTCADFLPLLEVAAQAAGRRWLCSSYSGPYTGGAGRRAFQCRP